MSKELEALERLMTDYYEMCQDLGNNDDQYQRCNLTSERAIIEKALKEHEQHKAIEKELGIDLVTLFTILRTGGCIWVKNRKGIVEWHVESLKQRGFDKEWYLTYSNNVRVKLRDYGRTWALTREELEK